jgi:hypothetical protein
VVSSNSSLLFCAPWKPALKKDCKQARIHAGSAQFQYALPGEGRSTACRDMSPWCVPWKAALKKKCKARTHNMHIKMHRVGVNVWLCALEASL